MELYSLADFHIQMNPLKELFDILQGNLCQTLCFQNQCLGSKNQLSLPENNFMYYESKLGEQTLSIMFPILSIFSKKYLVFDSFDPRFLQEIWTQISIEVHLPLYEILQLL